MDLVFVRDMLCIFLTFAGLVWFLKWFETTDYYRSAVDDVEKQWVQKGENER